MGGHNSHAFYFAFQISSYHLFHACAGGLLLSTYVPSRQHFLRTVFCLNLQMKQKLWTLQPFRLEVCWTRFWRDLLSIHMKMRFIALQKKSRKRLRFPKVFQLATMIHTYTEYPFEHAHYVTISCTWNGVDHLDVGFLMPNKLFDCNRYQCSFWYAAQALKPNLGPFWELLWPPLILKQPLPKRLESKGRSIFSKSNWAKAWLLTSLWTLECRHHHCLASLGCRLN